MKRLSILFLMFMGIAMSQSVWAYKTADLQRLLNTGKCVLKYPNSCDLRQADLSGINLRWNDLRDADLSGADLTETNLVGTNLSGVNLTNADLTGARLSSGNLDGTIFCNTKMPDGKINNSGCGGADGAGASTRLFGTGTAFVVARNYLLTASHVIDECAKVSIRHSHEEWYVEVVAWDEGNDVGLLKSTKSFQHTAKFRGGKSIRLGDTVVNYGYPLFGELSDHAKISKGEINSLAGMGNDSSVIQYDAATQPGNSGGPVLDLSGNVVGIVTSLLSKKYAEQSGHIAQNVNFAVKSYVAEGFLSANGVGFSRAESSERLETADIADKAERFTVLVGCWVEGQSIQRKNIQRITWTITSQQRSYTGTYEGELVDGVPHGKGIFVFENGVVSTSDWRNGIRVGHFITTGSGFKTEGELDRDGEILHAVVTEPSGKQTRLGRGGIAIED